MQNFTHANDTGKIKGRGEGRTTHIRGGVSAHRRRLRRRRPGPRRMPLDREYRREERGCFPRSPTVIHCDPRRAKKWRHTHNNYLH